MKLEHPDRVEFLQLDLIEVGSRARRVSDAAVLAIIDSAKSRDGGITTPIHVRRLKGGRFGLIDGAHRLAASCKMGRDTVPAQVWDCTLQEARFMEVDANLATAHVTPLDLAVSLAKRKQAYEDLHPETKRGVAGALSRHGLQVQEIAFADYIATMMGLKKRQIMQIISAGVSLSDSEINALGKAPERLAMNDLYQLAKIGEPEERARVVQLLTFGVVKTAAQARAKIAEDASEGIPKPDLKEPVEDAFNAMMKLWSRAPKAAKRRFVGSLSAELSTLLNDGGEDA